MDVQLIETEELVMLLTSYLRYIGHRDLPIEAEEYMDDRMEAITLELEKRGRN